MKPLLLLPKETPPLLPYEYTLDKDDSVLFFDMLGKLETRVPNSTSFKNLTILGPVTITHGLPHSQAIIIEFIGCTEKDYICKHEITLFMEYTTTNLLTGNIISIYHDATGSKRVIHGLIDTISRAGNKLQFYLSHRSLLYLILKPLYESNKDFLDRIPGQTFEL